MNTQTTTKRSEDVEPGDTIEFLGRFYRVSAIEPYTGPFDFIIGIARAAGGWGISLEAGALVTVAL